MADARHAIWVLLLVPACFHPTYNHPTCGPNGECPNGLTCSAQQICEAPGEASPDADSSGSGQCPASYDVTKLPGPSHYRLIVDGHRAWEQSDDCNDDLPGSTHLVVIETQKEFDDISAYIRPGLGTPMDSVWIGAVQLPTAAMPDDGWLGFDGAQLGASLTDNGWGGSEPNDAADNNEADHEEQFVRMTRTNPPFFIDDVGSKNYGAICECDGKPLATTVAAAIDGYRL